MIMIGSLHVVTVQKLILYTVNYNCCIGDVWKFSLLVNEWSELRLIKKPAPRFGFVAGTFEDYWYISHGECLAECLS